MNHHIQKKEYKINHQFDNSSESDSHKINKKKRFNPELDSDNKHKIDLVSTPSLSNHIHNSSEVEFSPKPQSWNASRDAQRDSRINDEKKKTKVSKNPEVKHTINHEHVVSHDHVVNHDHVLNRHQVPTTSSSRKIDNLITDTQKIYHNIPFRENFIKSLLKGGSVDPLIDDTKINDALIFGKHNHGGNHRCKDIRCILHRSEQNFKKVIKQIGGTIAYIKSGTTGHTFKGSAIDEKTQLGYNYAVKVVAYPKRENYGDPNDIRRPENTELLMIKVLSKLVLDKQTPHIVLPICIFNTDLSTFIDLSKILLKKHKRYRKFVKQYVEGAYHQSASVLISEWANGGDLLDYLRKNYKSFTLMHWKVLFFQILAALAVILATYPSFRHNDLKANNILVHLVKPQTGKTPYGINERWYDVPNMGFQLKLWDFDFACIPGIVDNSKVSAEWTKSINIRPIRNQYYDTHYFFNTLIRREFFPNFFTTPEIPQEVKDFINRVVPDKFKVAKPCKIIFKTPKIPSEIKDFIRGAMPKLQLDDKFKITGTNQIVFTTQTIPPEIKEFIKTAVPSRSFEFVEPAQIVAERGRILTNQEYTTPDKLLRNDPFFDVFRLTEQQGEALYKRAEQKRVAMETLVEQHRQKHH